VYLKFIRLCWSINNIAIDSMSNVFWKSMNISTRGLLIQLISLLKISASVVIVYSLIVICIIIPFKYYFLDRYKSNFLLSHFVIIFVNSLKKIAKINWLTYSFLGLLRCLFILYIMNIISAFFHYSRICKNWKEKLFYLIVFLLSK